MTVYVVFHEDIEGDRYVRGVCSTKERAEATVLSVEPCHDPSHAHTDKHPRWGYAHPSDEWGCFMARQHATYDGTTSYCCGVEEWDLDATPIAPVVIQGNVPLVTW